MSNLDEKLRLALRREEPPAGFAERVLERLPAAPQNVVEMPARDRNVSRFALAAAAALAVATGSIWLAIPRGDTPKAPPVTTTAQNERLGQNGPPDVQRVEPPTRPFVLVDSHPARRPRHRRVATEPQLDAEALRAAEQLRLALQIAGDKLNVAKHEVRETLTVPES